MVNAPPGPLSPPRRTWCFWEPDGGPFDASLTSSWSRLGAQITEYGQPGTGTCWSLPRP
ncbi:hypothetical protein JS521_02950 [Streptomyces sp. RHZ10]|uniref:Uncharacterized protein n=1 Tax=Streptomyces durocortorensis TaxID=2811104 RepID=A0ABS2HRA2_9ACTN|nr:hypothetical protein [Streptomyces durocortorensis]